MKIRWIRKIALVVFVCNFFNVQSQVEISKETTKKDEKQQKEKKIKEQRENGSTGKTSIYFNANWSYTTRKLIENDGLFGKPLGEREFETPSNHWSFGLGFRNQLHKNIALEAGISLIQNGERYTFEDVDTTFAYQTTYSYIAMPIKVLYTYGNDTKLMAGVGITPQMFMRYRQEQDWTTSLGAPESETVKSTIGYNNFVLSATLSVGVQFRIAKRAHFQFVPEYRIQLSSSNARNDAYKHYATALGGNIGLVFDI